MNFFKIFISSLLLLLVAGNLSGQNTKIKTIKKFGQVKIANPPKTKPTFEKVNTLEVDHDLNGTWKDQNGNPYYIKQVGPTVFWYGEEKSRASWANVYMGTISGDQLSGTFYDVPKGSVKGKGDLTFSISGNRLTMTSRSRFGSTTLTKQSSSSVRRINYLGPKNEQFKESNSLTGLWYGTNGGRYYVRQVGNTVVWFGERRTSTGHTRSGFANVAFGTKTGNTVRMYYADVPKGTTNGKGNFDLTVDNNKVMTKNKKFGASRFVKEGALNLPNGIITKNDLTSSLNYILRGNVKLHINNYGPRNGDSWYKPDDNWLEIFGDRQKLSDIPEHKHGVNDRKIHYLNDINLQSLNLAFSGNQIQITIAMEENGPELKGRCTSCPILGSDDGAADANLTDPRFKITADIIAKDCSISFDVKEVEYLGGVAGNGFLALANGIIENKMKPIIEGEMKVSLNENKSSIAAGLKRFFNGQCIKKVKYLDDKIIFDY